MLTIREDVKTVTISLTDEHLAQIILGHQIFAHATSECGERYNICLEHDEYIFDPSVSKEMKESIKGLRDLYKPLKKD
jgi:hypothetical protein